MRIIFSAWKLMGIFLIVECNVSWGRAKMLLGFCKGLPTMLEELHYVKDDSPRQAPEDFSKDDELHFETEMLDFYKAKVVSEDLGIMKKIINEGQRWESPRESYEVTSWWYLIGTMTLGEKSSISVSNAYLSESPLLKTTEDLEDVQFEVELIHFIQVCLPFIDDVPFSSKLHKLSF
ncbi:putative peptidylprolyl isomerase [Dioscorea sansibarensis]